MGPMDIELRLATPSDTAAVVDFVLDAGGGLFEQMLEGVIPGVPLRDLVALSVSDEDSSLNFRNCLMAQQNDHVVGMALAFPAVEFGMAGVALDVIPATRLDPIREIMSARIDGSYYLNSLAVVPDATGRGIARQLLETSAELGEALGFSDMSLQVWADNTRARGLYEGLGFTTQRELPAGDAPYLRYRGPMLLMQVAISQLLSALRRREPR
jgi:ribosomal protein S18 acetylase RimI-like enzyme